MAKGRFNIAVIGAASCSEQGYQTARTVGRLIALRRGYLICGGRGGVMEAAARGAKEAGGVTIGLLPGELHAEANPYIDIALPTGQGIARNALIIYSAHGLIAVEGGYGTLSEMAMALKLGRPLVAVDSWPGVPGPARATTPEEAVELLFTLIK